MKLFEIVLIAFGLAMDAFAVSVCKGISMKKIDYKKAIIIGLYFGIFQGLMPVIGYLFGINFQALISNIDHWIAFILLAIIGGKMISEAFGDDSDEINDDLSIKTMLILAIATSIDALAIGITFAFLNVNIITSSLIIGIITFILSVIGVKIGARFGDKFGKRAEIIGGIILILIGVKILFEHLGII